jgi:hypothetical protein
MPEHRGREIIGARFDTDAKFAYASLPEEEAIDFYVERMNTGPEVPLAAADAENEILYVNEDEEWGFAQDAVPQVERPSSDYLGWSWEEDPETAAQFDSAELYAEASGLDVELVGSEGITELVDTHMERNVQETIPAYSITLDEPDRSGQFR